VALLAQDLGVVISASHNPPEYNGVKFFDAEGHKLPDAAEEEIEQLLELAPGDVKPVGGGSIEVVDDAADGYVDHVVAHFGSDLSGLRIAVDCANGAFSAIAPGVFERLGADVTTVAASPDGTNINVGCGATDLALLQEVVRAGGHDLGVAFDGDGDRMLAVDETGEALDGDQILAVLVLARGVDTVAVTTMTNYGFHRLMEAHGIRVLTTDVGDRYVLEALRAEGAVLGAEQSGHVICLDGHVTGDGLAAALLLCGALDGRRLSEAAAVLELLPQAKENVAMDGRALTREVLAEIERLDRQLGSRGRILVRPSGTEPVIRVLVESESAEEAADVSGKVASLIRSQPRL
jgi:phosphoglucosamine mutase